jgi:hypothetical protein
LEDKNSLFGAVVKRDRRNGRAFQFSKKTKGNRRDAEIAETDAE